MRIEKNSWIVTTPIAHRGIWGGKVPENSLIAYKRAIEKNFPIELDVYLTTDDVLVCFHDDNLKRMTGVDGLIYEKTYSELKELKLAETENTIPTFDEVLETIDGRTPILIEIKNQPNKSVVDKLIDRLKNYNGEFAIESFNPFFIKRVKKLAPDFIRGILGTENAKGESFIKRFVLYTMCLNFLCKPDFISYSHTGLPIPFKRKVKKKVVLAWTISDQVMATLIKPCCDNIIFENFIPKDNPKK